jgi:allene oxide cyclase
MKIHALASVFVFGAAAVFGLRGQSSNTMSLTVVERATTDVVTDVGEEGDSVGDVLTFANEVYDEANETQVGTDSGYCIRTAVGVGWECFWTMTLEDGQIMVQGPFSDTGDSTMAIIGGTGAYANAGGEMGLHSRNAEGTEFDFSYQISMNS